MADETYPHELKYFAEHDWVRAEADQAIFGVTWFAQETLAVAAEANPALAHAAPVSMLVARLYEVEAARHPIFCHDFSDSGHVEVSYETQAVTQ